MKYDAIIIGGGIAGVTAAIYLKRANKNVVLFESSYIGGQIINASNVENYPGYKQIKGYELGKIFIEQLNGLNIEVRNEIVNKISGDDEDFTVTTNVSNYNCKKIVIATGTAPRKLGIENEDYYLGKGLSFCATCDGAFFRGKDVAVLGGGNSAIDDALYLSDLCNKVYLIHRRDVFVAEEARVNLLKEKSNVEFVLNANIKTINGSNNIESINIIQNGEEKTINAQGVFVCIGRTTNYVFSDDINNKDGYIITDSNMETNISGVYAIGDVRDKEVRQLTTAAADGTIAAMDIIKKL